ncbi:hypothetical protein CSA17_07020 [bacterium DOLJORAL78_65_58]|nr:MAG: hypothetical protein CSA17_07020 [bacterium DOLJORAL78_65_58]
MVVMPCSMKTLAGVTHGFSNNLLLRAADVTLKERRKLVLVTRETPLSGIHLQNMAAMAGFGAVILPPMLTYYNHPRNMQDQNNHIVGKVLSEFGLEMPEFRRWGSPGQQAPYEPPPRTTNEPKQPTTPENQSRGATHELQ